MKKGQQIGKSDPHFTFLLTRTIFRPNLHPILPDLWSSGSKSQSWKERHSKIRTRDLFPAFQTTYWSSTAQRIDYSKCWAIHFTQPFLHFEKLSLNAANQKTERWQEFGQKHEPGARARSASPCSCGWLRGHSCGRGRAPGVWPGCPSAPPPGYSPQKAWNRRQQRLDGRFERISLVKRWNKDPDKRSSFTVWMFRCQFLGKKIMPCASSTFY